MYREEDEPECLEFFEDEEVAQLPIYDRGLVSRMPTGMVEQEVKDSLFELAPESITADPSFLGPAQIQRMVMHKIFYLAQDYTWCLLNSE